MCKLYKRQIHRQIRKKNILLTFQFFDALTTIFLLHGHISITNDSRGMSKQMTFSLCLTFFRKRVVT